MTKARKLSASEISERLGGLKGWTLKANKIHREFTFPDFGAAFAFMTAIAAEAEALNHHPEWCNVYNRVTIDLCTHSCTGLSELDFELASRINRQLDTAQTQE
jgi:4a-hydroxytetrahydrobiopterin dehydratase